MPRDIIILYERKIQALVGNFTDSSEKCYSLDPRREPAPSILFSFCAAICTLPGCGSPLGVVVVVFVAAVPVVPAAGEVAVVEVIGMVI